LRSCHVCGPSQLLTGRSLAGQARFKPEDRHLHNGRDWPSLGSPMPGAPKAVTPRAAFPVSAPRSERIPLGRHSKPSRIRLPHGAPIAAAPTLATVVAAFFMSQQMPANAAVAEVTPNPNHSASLDAVYGPDASSATGATSLSSSQLMLATRTVMMSDMQRAYQAAWHEKQEKASTSLPRWYTVQPGDSLSSIAQHFYDNSAACPLRYRRLPRSSGRPCQRLPRTMLRGTRARHRSWRSPRRRSKPRTRFR
jgi:hypothetical protein